MPATMNAKHSASAEYTPDVIVELSHQHDRIVELIGEAHRSIPDERLAKFAELREFLIMHETVEQLVVRPIVGPIDDCDQEQRERMGRQLRAAEASMRGPGAIDAPDQLAEPLNQIVERTYRAIHDAA